MKEDFTVNNRNINAAGRPQTIRTALEKLSAASARCCRRCQARRQARSFERHIKSFANTNVCYIAVNGISIPVPLC